MGARYIRGRIKGKIRFKTLFGELCFNCSIKNLLIVRNLISDFCLFLSTQSPYQGSACKIFRKPQILHFTKNLEADFTFYILQGPVKKSDFTFYKLQGSVKTSFYKLHFTEFYKILQITFYKILHFTRKTQ